MTEPNAYNRSVSNARDRIIIALDVDSADEAREIIVELRESVGAFKIGLQLFTAEGARFVREITDAGVKVFLDLKFHDIPNTVAKASVAAAKLGVWMFNVHIAGGSEMMRQSVAEVAEASQRENFEIPLIIGVTVLTSSNVGTLREIGVGKQVEDQVVMLARLAAESGLNGVVASANEVAAIRQSVTSQKFLTVTPGIRPNLATVDDQKRVTTLGQALSNGSDFVVIGRPVTKAKDRIEAVETLVREIQA